MCRKVESPAGQTGENKIKTVSTSTKGLYKTVSVKAGTPYIECPRYAKCSVNNCPLHPLYPDLYTDPNDPGRKCGLGKTYRVRIAANYPELSLRGMTTREHAAKVTWESKSPEERARIIEGGKKNLITPLSQKENKNDDTSYEGVD